MPDETRCTTHVETLRSSVLIAKLIAAEAQYGDMGVAMRCGVKLRMWQMVKLGQTRFGTRAFPAILRNFPELRDDLMAYIESRYPVPDVAVA